MPRADQAAPGHPSPGCVVHPGRRVAVIGDIAGHLDELRAELRRLGADRATGRLPEGLTVVQVGDLVHRGPASDEVVALVDGYLTHQPAQWIQLVGNHEAQYLRDPVFEWPERVSTRSADTLRRWWAQGRMRAAAWVRDDTESYLVTHAGVTVDFWRGPLASAAGAERAATAINALIGVHDEVLFRAGALLRGRPPGLLSGRQTQQRGGVGPLWASAAAELLPGWLTTTLPFSQLHGHDSIFDWRRRCFRTTTAVAATVDPARLTVLDEQAKHETTVLAGGRIIGIDPCHGSQPCRPWRAWELPARSG